MKRTSAFLAVFASMSLMACSGQPLSGREKGTLGGAAVGAGLGAIVGHQLGHAGAGTAIGGGFGALTGALIGNESDRVDVQTRQQDERLRHQEEELQRQRRELEELRRERGSDTYRSESHSGGSNDFERDERY